MSSVMKRNIETAAGLIPAAGALIAIAGLNDAAVITPEHQRLLVWAVIWGLSAVSEIAILVLVKKLHNRGTQKWKQLRCIQAVVILVMMLFLLALHEYFEMDTLFVSCLRSTPLICMLCLASLLLIAVGETKAVKLLLIVISVLIAVAICSPVTTANWNGIDYSVEVFRIGLGLELFMLIYLIAILPWKQNLLISTHLHTILRDGIWWREAEISKRGTHYIRNIQNILSLSGAAFFLASGEENMGFLYVAAIVMIQVVMSRTISADSNNRFVIAFAVFVQLLYNFNDSLSAGGGSYYELYVTFGIMALVGSIRMYRGGLFAFSELAICTITIIKLIRISAYSYLSYAEAVSASYLCLAELLLSCSVLLFGYPKWTCSISTDLTKYLFEDDVEQIEVIDKEEENYEINN